MVDVWDFPREWYNFSAATFRLRSRSQTAERPWAGGKSVYGPHAQVWMVDLSMNPTIDPVRQEVEAWFERVGGQAGLIRIADPSRTRCYYDRALTPTEELWSDGGLWSDGLGWVAGYLPASVQLAEDAERGATYIQIKGMPASLNPALRKGDNLQINPNGVPSSCPSLYRIVAGGATDASGFSGIEIRPGLRRGFAAGDCVTLRYPSGVFRLVDDDQAAMQITPHNEITPLGTLGFSLVEAVDRAL